MILALPTYNFTLYVDQIISHDTSSSGHKLRVHSEPESAPGLAWPVKDVSSTSLELAPVLQVESFTFWQREGEVHLQR